LVGNTATASAIGGKRSVKSLPFLEIDRDVLAVFVELDAVAVELYFVEPLVADWRPVTQEGRGGDDERGATQHEIDMPSVSWFGNKTGALPIARGPQ
jgi:hypothetical protein